MCEIEDWGFDCCDVMSCDVMVCVRESSNFEDVYEPLFRNMKCVEDVPMKLMDR